MRLVAIVENMVKFRLKVDIRYYEKPVRTNFSKSVTGSVTGHQG
jgi:hypothetical protein